MMKSFSELPGDYIECLTLDLQKDRKKMLLINLGSGVTAVVMAVLMHFYVPISTFFTPENGVTMYFIRLFVFLAAVIAYIPLHELIHGAAMKICGTKKVSYGFTGVYAYAGSEDYYDRPAYIFIAFAPVVLFLVVLAVINALVPLSWFWSVYLIQIMNVSGSAGDIYVTCKFLRMPKGILVKDAGVSMTVYTRQA